MADPITPPVTSPVDDTGKIMDWIDKMDGFKRFMLVLPMELAFIGVVLAMAYQGKVDAALAAVGTILGSMIGYYFGKAATP